MWQVTRDTWHVTPHTWHVGGGEPSLSYLALTVWEQRFVENSFTKDQWVTTPGLIIPNRMLELLRCMNDSTNTKIFLKKLLAKRRILKKRPETLETLDVWWFSFLEMAAPRFSPVAQNVTQIFNTDSASGYWTEAWSCNLKKAKSPNLWCFQCFRSFKKSFFWLGIFWYFYVGAIIHTSQEFQCHLFAGRLILLLLKNISERFFFKVYQRDFGF